MTGTRVLEHTVLRVTDVDDALAFYTDVMGLVELARDDDIVYLGCGLDENYDLGLVEGGTGVEHFAIRVPDSETLADYETRLQDAGVDVTRTDGGEYSQDEGIRFSLPSGVDMELVTVEDPDYLHPTQAAEGRGGIAPRNLDHINLMSHIVDEDVDFLTEHVDFKVSDKIVHDDGSSFQSWLRFGRFHHDAGFTESDDPDETLHHLGFDLDSMEHIKRFCDRLAQHGYRLELGPSRHNAGSNLFAYFWGPGGNRIELSAEMATLDEAAETGVRELSDTDNTVSSWGGDVQPPESFSGGS
ncbi:VOC family protein [Halovenus marina]|uniref:VOC family protein n=1 Tax=Halovenus marina TaxID=3396621 RepID=UPI003F55190E